MWLRSVKPLHRNHRGFNSLLSHCMICPMIPLVVDCALDPIVKWSITLPCHGGITGSNPVRVVVPTLSSVLCVGSINKLKRSVTQLVEWVHYGTKLLVRVQSGQLEIISTNLHAFFKGCQFAEECCSNNWNWGGIPRHHRMMAGFIRLRSVIHK